MRFCHTYIIIHNERCIGITRGPLPLGMELSNSESVPASLSVL